MPPCLRNLTFAIAVISLCFVKPLLDMTLFACRSQFYSHLPLVPIISAYFVWIQRAQLAPRAEPPPRVWAALPLGVGALLGLLYFIFLMGHGNVPLPDQLAVGIAGYIACVVGACCWFLDSTTLRKLSFSLGMLLFMIPFPEFVTDCLEFFFQHTSAVVAEVMLTLSGTDFLRDGLVIHLPNITIKVAPECSGIRSSLVLFITSIIAGKMFLDRTRHRVLLAVFVIPLAIVRNGFRIFTISWLCVQFGPEMIDSPIHHQGGPVFFALSLIPFFAFLWWLRRLERKHRPPTAASVNR